jgi:hypothetical protein
LKRNSGGLQKKDEKAMVWQRRRLAGGFRFARTKFKITGGTPALPKANSGYLAAFVLLFLHRVEIASLRFWL